MDSQRISSLPRPAVRRLNALLHLLSARRGPLEFQILGRTLLHAALVGTAAGLLGSFFFAGVEVVQRYMLEEPTGYVTLRAAGERVLEGNQPHPFRPWLLFLIPGAGALLAGIISARFAPETRGGGADALIDAFHNHKGFIRKRVAFVKAIVSILTLGSGGSGGREGPTMQMGGAIGSLVGRMLRVTDRERRILLVAGTAAGMAAVFRTPLGAALLAVEVLHRDDFETDALVPAVLASVVSYSVFISIFDQATLFAHAAHYPFVPAHLPLYALMAVFVSLGASLFVGALSTIKQLSARVRVPDWAKPAIGGLALGAFATPMILMMEPFTGQPGRGLGILGGGYGAAQLAITGSEWLSGWRGIELLLILALVKIIATSLTVGSGGSAGDFGPSLVIGALLGGAFGRAAGWLMNDPRIDPGAFALVGMGTFYGGIAHVPIASLVMVCELAGSYELLVPLMLAEGIAFVALRHRKLYPAQMNTKRESPAHRDDLIFDVLKGVRVVDVLIKDRPYVTFAETTAAPLVFQQIASSGWQDVFPVLSAEGKLVGMISSDILRTMALEPNVAELTIAHDLMVSPICVRDTDDLRTALEAILRFQTRELVVTDEGGRVVGFLDESEITHVYHNATEPSELSR